MVLASMARWAALFGGLGRDDEEDAGGIVGLIAMAILAPIALNLIQFASHDPGSIWQMKQVPTYQKAPRD